MPWGRALLVLSAIAAAHLGLFLVLTASARSEVAAIEQLHAPDALEAAKDPGTRPAGSPREVARWHQRQSQWEDARTYRSPREFIGMLGYGLLGSFLVQAGVLAVLLHRSAVKRRDAARRARRA